MGTNDAADLSIHDALVEVQKAWNRLMRAMAAAPKADYSRKRDAAGWTALDHLAHVTAWERSRLTWLQGRPRFEGLGVTSEVFKRGYDDLNELVRQRTDGQGYDEVLEAAQRGHQAMIAEIQTFDPDDVDRSGGIQVHEIPRVGALLKENLADHYDAHRAYIERILAS
jgi:hypothetical protein